MKNIISELALKYEILRAKKQHEKELKLISEEKERLEKQKIVMKARGQLSNEEKKYLEIRNKRIEEQNKKRAEAIRNFNEKSVPFIKKMYHDISTFGDRKYRRKRSR